MRNEIAIQPQKAESQEIKSLRREVAKAEKDSRRWAERSGQASRVGATRARITTINANWSNAARRRDDLKKMLEAALAQAEGC